MDVKALAGTMRSGRRSALAGLLAGAAALVGRRVDTEAGKRRCPRCPQRVCCLCTDPSPTPGCRLAPAATANDSVSSRCEKACGGPGTVAAGQQTTPNSGETLVCASGGDTCINVSCPLY